METLIYPAVLENLQDTLVKLSEYYHVDLTDCNVLLDQYQKLYYPTHSSTCNYHRCQARIWNGGISDQCHRKCEQGTKYCSRHGMPTQLPLCIKCTEYYKKNCYHSYQWEHFGNINDPLPDFFRS